MTEMAIYYDTSKCTGCKGCMVACKTWNDLPSPIKQNSQPYSGTLQNPVDLNENTRIIMTYREKKRENEYGVDWAFGRRACMHCTNAACVNVCPSGCLHHDDNGFVVMDIEKCIGCQYCRTACPFDVPRHTGLGVAGDGVKINKCDGCASRVAHGMKPACVDICQPNALDFGPREEMLTRAHERVDWLHKKGFDQARVYGENEVGGTHVIYVLKYDISQYELPEKPNAGRGTVSNVVKPLTALAAAGIVGGLGITYARAHGYHRDKMAYDTQTNDVVDMDKGKVDRHIDKKAGER